jgi:hypothetical protein
MSTESKRESNNPSSSERHLPLKGSDFFPPGAGWNQAKKPDQSSATRQHSTDKYPAERRNIQQ